jgi:hypothetical protein
LIEERNIFRADFDRAASRHRVAGVDREIENNKFQLACVNLDRPQAGWELERHMDIAPQAAVEQFAHPSDLAGQVDCLRLQFLTPGKSQKLPCQAGSAFGGLTHPVHQPFAPGRVRLAVEHFQTSGNDHQQIVEIVSDAAGQLTDRFDLLSLPKLFLDMRTHRHLVAQGLIGGLELLGPQNDLLLQFLRGLLALRQQPTQLQLPGSRAKCRLYRADQGLGLDRPLQKRHVAQRVDQPLPPRLDTGLLLAAGQQDEGKIRPRRLIRNPFEQEARVFSKQRFFSNKRSCSTGLQRCHKAVKIAAGVSRDAAPAEQAG